MPKKGEFVERRSSFALTPDRLKTQEIRGKNMKITISAARKNAGLTQEVAAKKIGVATTTLSNWEIGKTAPKAKDIVKLCSVYGVRIENVKIF